MNNSRSILIADYCPTSIFGREGRDAFKSQLSGMDRWKALTAKDFWNGQMESPHSKGLLKWTDGRPSQQRIFWNGQMESPHSKGSWCPSTWSETNWQLTHTSDGLKQTGSLPILQMVWSKLAAYPYFRRWGLPCFSSGTEEGGLCSRTLNWMWGLAGSALQDREGSSKILKSWQLLLCYNAYVQWN